MATCESGGSPAAPLSGLRLGLAHVRLAGFSPVAVCTFSRCRSGLLCTVSTCLCHITMSRVEKFPQCLHRGSYSLRERVALFGVSIVRERARIRRETKSRALAAVRGCSPLLSHTSLDNGLQEVDAEYSRLLGVCKY